MLNLSGKWKGTFKYDDGTLLTPIDTEYSFLIEIYYEEPNFTGICIDGYTELYCDKPAIIEGTFDSNYISFIKKYPSKLAEDEDGNTIVFHDLPALDIHYTGLLSKGIFSGYAFNGEWSVTDDASDDLGEKQYFTTSGTWNMRKA